MGHVNNDEEKQLLKLIQTVDPLGKRCAAYTDMEPNSYAAHVGPGNSFLSSYTYTSSQVKCIFIQSAHRKRSNFK